jgi:hypothetical protein
MSLPQLVRSPAGVGVSGMGDAVRIEAIRSKVGFETSAHNAANGQCLVHSFAMQGLVSLLLLFGLCFAVERGVRELRGRDAATPLTKARWLVASMLVGYRAAFFAGSFLLHQALTGPVAQ